MASKEQNLEHAIQLIDAKMGKLSHRRGQIEAQLSAYRAKLTASGIGLSSQPVEQPTLTLTQMGVKATTSGCDYDSHIGDLGGVDVLTVYCAVNAVRSSLPGSDIDALSALKSIDAAWDIRHVIDDSAKGWLREHRSDIMALANEQGLKVHWLNYLS